MPTPNVTLLQVTQIIALILALLTTYLGIKWRKTKKLLKETSEALTVLNDAIEDDHVTENELNHIVKEFRDIITAAKQFKA